MSDEETKHAVARMLKDHLMRERVANMSKRADTIKWEDTPEREPLTWGDISNQEISSVMSAEQAKIKSIMDAERETTSSMMRQALERTFAQERAEKEAEEAAMHERERLLKLPVMQTPYSMFLHFSAILDNPRFVVDPAIEELCRTYNEKSLMPFSPYSDAGVDFCVCLLRRAGMTTGTYKTEERKKIPNETLAAMLGGKSLNSPAAGIVSWPRGAGKTGIDKITASLNEFLEGKK